MGGRLGGRPSACAPLRGSAAARRARGFHERSERRARAARCRAARWPLSERDYPSGEIVLGMEIREHSVKAALVDTGCGEFVRPGMVKAIHESSVDGVLGAVRSVIRACNWKGAVGCSVTRVVWRTLGATQAEKTLSGVDPTLTDKVAVMIHTEAAAYAEMLCGAAQNNAGRVLILTVGQNLGVVVYEDGEKVRGLDVSHLFWKWEHELKDLQETYSFQGISPPLPQPGAKPSDSWMAWTQLCSKFVGKICNEVRPKTVVMMPTGMVAQQPRDLLVKFISRGVSSDVDIIVGARPEGAMIRGAAIGAYKELNTLQASNQLKECIVRHAGTTNIQLVSNKELHDVFDILDADKDGILTLRELEERANEIGLMCTTAELQGLMRYLCHDKSKVEFAEFCNWWKELQTSAAIRHCMSSTELTDALDFLKEDSLVFISGKTCASCKRLQAPFLQLALDYTQVNFLQMHMDSNRSTWEFCKEMGIKQIPAFLFYRNGRLEASLDSTDPADLEVFIKTMSKEEEFDNLEVNVPNLE